MVKKNLDDLATMLHEARLKALPVPQLTKTYTDLSRDEAYSIQEQQLRLRQIKGEVQVGWKMGLTSEAKRKQMNLDAPLYGFLTDKMKISEKYDLTGKIHPKIEPEIAFLISKDLSGTVTREQVLQACEGVAACMEILDSRYEQFKYFSMEDVISDNSSSSHFVLGPWSQSFSRIDLKNLKMKMFVNNELAQSGVSSDISGDPVVSVIELCHLLSLRNQKLMAGQIVLAGAATPAVELKPGMQVKLEVDNLESIEVMVERST